MNWKWTNTESELDAPIAQVLDRMSVADPEEEHYKRLCERLETLIKLRDTKSKSWTTSPAFITVVGNLLVTGMVIGYERHGVMTSKSRDWHVTTKTT